MVSAEIKFPGQSVASYLFISPKWKFTFELQHIKSSTGELETNVRFDLQARITVLDSTQKCNEGKTFCIL